MKLIFSHTFCLRIILILCFGFVLVLNAQSQLLLSTDCPGSTADVSGLTTSNQPLGSTVTWHSGAPVSDANRINDVSALPPGTYYVAFYNAAEDCYSDELEIMISDEYCLENLCPDTTVDLTTALTTPSNIPNGSSVTYHTGLPVTSANQVNDPSAVSEGSYFVAFFNPVGACFSGDGFTAAEVVVSRVACSACNLTSVNLINETCNDNSTDTDASDDYISFDLNPMGEDLGSGYTLSVDNGGIFEGGNIGNYGGSTSFRLQDGSADGTTYTITITDNDDNSCTTNITVGQSACSFAEQNCIDGIDNDGDGDIDCDDSNCSSSYICANCPSSPVSGNGLFVNHTTVAGTPANAGGAPDGVFTGNLAGADNLTLSYDFDAGSMVTGEICITVGFNNTNGRVNFNDGSTTFSFVNALDGTGDNTRAPQTFCFETSAAGTFNVIITESGGGNVRIDGSNFAYCPSLLPIELIHFEASSTDAGVELLWSTATEINNAYFDLERSVDGTSYEKIAQIAGAGTSNTVTDYTYLDQDAIVGTNYYRLTNIDFDGTRHTNPIITIDHDGLNVSNNISIYPNPAQTGDQLISIRADFVDHVIIYDAQGKVVLKKRMTIFLT